MLVDAVRSLWPLTENFEYAAEVGLALRSRKPDWWARFEQQLPAERFGSMVQAQGFGFLQWCERSVDTFELVDLCAAAIGQSPGRIRVELDASLECQWRDFAPVEDPFAPEPLSGEPVVLYAPGMCSGYPDGASLYLDDWTRLALQDAVVVERGAPSAELTDLARAHSGTYVQDLAAFAAAGGGPLTPETFVTEDAMRACLGACGALMDASDRALRGELDGPALCLVRPGSHHAERTRAGGTCLVNNLAVAAAFALRRGAKRVAVVDIDAHHGNGTEDIFREDPRVFTLSVHQEAPFFPGTGEESEVGRGAGRGKNLNVAVSPSEDWLERFELGLMAVARHRPQLILVEFSTDAHRADPVSDLTLSDDDFASAVSLIQSLDVPVVYELGASSSERAWVGGVRALVRAAGGYR